MNRQLRYYYCLCFFILNVIVTQASSVSVIGKLVDEKGEPVSGNIFIDTVFTRAM